MSRILFEFADLIPDPVVAAPVFALDPPGGIGLDDDEAVVLLRFDEAEAAIRPKDAAGSLQDLGITTGLTLAAVGDGALGRARVFSASTGTGFVAKDIVSGASLLTRDMSIQVVAAWNAVGQAGYGTSGMLVQRGLGFAVGGAPEIRCYALLIEPTGIARQGSLQWQWQDENGSGHAQAGALFAMPTTGFTMFTATRRWISPTEVLIRYFVGDVKIGEFITADGAIGGATTGTMQIGCSPSGGGFGQFFVGSIDEIMILPRELTPEEVEATWLRLTRYQPLGVQLFREMHDPGFPMPTDPGSDVQREIRYIGTALGYAAAQAENVRANMLPRRSYGSVLEDWETALQVTPQPHQDIDTRRARAEARLRQRRGSTPPGFQDSLEGLLGGASVDDLEFLAFDNTVRDDFATLNLLRWDVTPAASWVAASGAARSSPAAGTYLMTGVVKNWLTSTMSVGGDGREARILCKVAMTTPQASLETGVYFGEAVGSNYLLLGLRDDAGTFKIVTESFIANVSQGLVVQATLGGNPANLWLHLYQTTAQGTWKAAWSTTSATTGFATSADITHPTLQLLAGMYVRSTGATAGAAQVNLDDFVMRQPFGTRPFNAYVFLDSALGFSPDRDGANSVVKAVKHAFVDGAFITSKSLLCDDLESSCDGGPMGGI